MRFAFTTLACPTWTMDRVVSFARDAGFAGVELRTFGHADPRLACDPCHTDGAKIREVCEDAGVDVCGIATSIRYDERVWPPFIGRVTGDFDKPVRETKSMIEVARATGAEYVRVFGFELGEGEERGRGSRRVVERATAAAATARHTGVRLVLENGGTYAKARDLAELVDRCRDSRIGAAYALGPASDARDDIADGALMLGERLDAVRVTDLRAGRPARLGEGDLAVRETVERLAAVGYDGWVVVEWPRVWMPNLEDPGRVLEQAAARLYEWSAGAARSRTHHDPGVRVGARL